MTDTQKTVTLADLAQRLGIEPAGQQALAGFVGASGPWTEAEAQELEHVWQHTDPRTGIYQEPQDGKTPAEARTGVADAEAAILDTLARLRTTVRHAIQHGYDMGVASTSTDPTALLSVLASAGELHAHVKAIAEATDRIGSWLPQVRGKRAMDDGETPPMSLWFRPPVERSGWLVTASPERPGPEWLELFTR